MKTSSHRIFARLSVLSLILITLSGGRALSASLEERSDHLPPNISEGSQTDTLHTPAPGSAERQAIMDALREHLRTNLGNLAADVTFEVNHLKVHNGWAWVDVTEKRADGTGDGWDTLLRKEKGRWKVKESPFGLDEIPPDEKIFGDDHSLYAKRIRAIRKLYPSVPTDIFPKP